MTREVCIDCEREPVAISSSGKTTYSRCIDCRNKYMRFYRQRMEFVVERISVIARKLLLSAPPEDRPEAARRVVERIKRMKV